MKAIEFFGKGLAYFFFFIWGAIALAMIIPFVLVGVAIACIVTSPIWIPRIPYVIIKIIGKFFKYLSIQREKEVDDVYELAEN